jgi:hypothetical protein
MQRRETTRWNAQDGVYGTLSVQKLQHRIDLEHPRIFVKENGQTVARRIELCHPIGDLSDAIFDDQDGEETPEVCCCAALFYSPGERLSAQEREIDQLQTRVFDQLGVGVSLYFKLLKAILLLIGICTVMSMPLYYFYSCGKLYEQASSLAERTVTYFSLGNIGESSVRCTKGNIRYEDDLSLFCPADTSIAYMKDFGIERITHSPAICPVQVTNSSAITLDLASTCSLDYFKINDPQRYDRIKNSFRDVCIGNTECSM